ncbi:AraC family transcriptional regulator [Maricurvus nonylphenolicus]|uniref:AraC family transcriptional regulator n=1 Tax=Maricurvus nonylphenolicus TaxID=1008307 RepID=UPI0036F2165A
MIGSENNAKHEGVPCGWLLAALQDKGLSLAQLKERLPGYLDGSELSDVVLPLELYIETIEWGAKVLDNENLGIEISCQAKPYQFGIIGYLVANAASVADSLDLVTHYYKVFSHYFDAYYTVEDDICRYYYKPAAINDSDMRQDIDFSLGMIVNSFNLFTPKDWAPEHCSFTYSEPKDTSELKRFFGANIHFDQPKNFIAFKKDILDIPLSDSDPALLKILKQHANQILEQISEEKSLAEHVKLLIATNLGTEQLNTTSIANSLNMSVRNLHRLLSEKGTSFQQLRDQTTLEIAKEALLETQSSVTDIALKLGFSESSAFVRKFKQQSGMTPLQFRKSHKV